MDERNLESIADLLRALHSPDSARIQEVVGSLQALPRDEIVRKLVEIQNGPDYSLSCDASEALVRIDGPPSFQLLLPMLKHHEAKVRWWNCELISNIADETIVHYLCEILESDSESHVRLAAANALGRTMSSSALAVLRSAAQHDSGADWEGRTVADAAREAIERITAPPKPRWS